jgi:hypothetical protein
MAEFPSDPSVMTEERSAEKLAARVCRALQQIDEVERR